jgi:hypothetical protein
MSIEREEARQIVETAEMRIAASVVRIEAGLEAFKELTEERDRAHREEFARLRSDMADMRGDIKSVRRTTVVTGISATLAILFGLSAINSGLLTHFREGVDGGSRAAAEHEAIRREMRELVRLVERSGTAEPAQPKK